MNSREVEMRRLRFDKEWTLEKIGEEFGVSRQRVQQIIGSTGYISATKRKRISRVPELSRMTVREVMNKYGVSVGTAYRAFDGRWHPASGNAATSRGHNEELAVAKELRAKGITCELVGIREGYDCKINDKYTARIHTAFKKCDSALTANTSWRFVLKSWRKGTDFLILKIKPLNALFIIPGKLVDEKGSKTIQFAYPTSRPTMSKWQKYLNRFDLLD